MVYTYISLLGWVFLWGFGFAKYVDELGYYEKRDWKFYIVGFFINFLLGPPLILYDLLYKRLSKLNFFHFIQVYWCYYFTKKYENLNKEQIENLEQLKQIYQEKPKSFYKNKSIKFINKVIDNNK